MGVRKLVFRSTTYRNRYNAGGYVFSHFRNDNSLNFTHTVQNGLITASEHTVR